MDTKATVAARRIATDAGGAVQSQRHSGPGKLKSLAGYAVRCLHQRLSSGLGPVLEAEGLRAHQFTALSLIVDNPSMSQNELARALAIKPSNIVPLVDEMERRELVQRVPGSVNRRSYALIATRKGEESRDRTFKAMTDYENELLEPLSRDERESLTKLAIKLGVM